MTVRFRLPFPTFARSWSATGPTGGAPTPPAPAPAARVARAAWACSPPSAPFPSPGSTFTNFWTRARRCSSFRAASARRLSVKTKSTSSSGRASRSLCAWRSGTAPSSSRSPRWAPKTAWTSWRTRTTSPTFHSVWAKPPSSALATSPARERWTRASPRTASARKPSCSRSWFPRRRRGITSSSELRFPRRG